MSKDEIARDTNEESKLPSRLNLADICQNDCNQHDKPGSDPSQNLRTEQLARWLKAFDTPLLNKDAYYNEIPQQSKDKLADAKETLKSKPDDTSLRNLPGLEISSGHLPEKVRHEAYYWLLGEAANQIMKDKPGSNNAHEFLLEKAILSVKLNHLPSPAELKNVENQKYALETAAELRREQLNEDHPWNDSMYEQLHRLGMQQVGRSIWKENGYSDETKSGRLGCADYVTTPLAAAGLVHHDLDVNGAVGQLLVAGFKPTSIDSAIKLAQGIDENNDLAIIVRPPKVDNHMKLQKAGHIGYAYPGEEKVNHNSSSKGVGIYEPLKGNSSFNEENGAFILLPPDYESKSKPHS